jgi:predicted nucleic acid-binding protein
MISAVQLVVVDPRVLVRAFVYPRGDVARLLALFAYGRISRNADGFPLEELEGMIDWAKSHGGTIDQAAAEARAERDIEEAKHRRATMEDVFEQLVPSYLLLVTSPPLLTELVDLAQWHQGRGFAHVRPDRVRTHTNSHTFKALPDLGPAPNYLSRGRVSKHDYLIHTAMEAEADTLVTEDQDLLLPGDARHENAQTKHQVHPYNLDDFIVSLPHNLSFNEIEPERLLQAAVARPSWEPA